MLVQIAKLYTEQMCTVCIRSGIKEHDPSVKENNFLVKGYNTKNRGPGQWEKCPCACLLVGQARGLLGQVIR